MNMGGLWAIARGLAIASWGSMAQRRRSGFASTGVSPYTSSIRRIEGGMLSYHADADIHTNPFELGFDRLVNLDMEADFIGKAALRRIRDEGVSRKQVGLIIEGAPLEAPNTTFWAINKDGEAIGKVTSAVYSPRLQQNIALAMVAADQAVIGTEVDVVSANGSTRARIVERPFYDPKKQIAAA
jgi:glycine cleavage system aminomethyltransferase T